MCVYSSQLSESQRSSSTTEHTLSTVKFASNSLSTFDTVAMYVFVRYKHHHIHKALSLRIRRHIPSSSAFLVMDIKPKAKKRIFTQLSSWYFTFYRNIMQETYDLLASRITVHFTVLLPQCCFPTVYLQGSAASN